MECGEIRPREVFLTDYRFRSTRAHTKETFKTRMIFVQMGMFELHSFNGLNAIHSLETSFVLPIYEQPVPNK